MKKTLAVLSIFLGLSLGAFGQTFLTQTTLAAAITDSAATQIRVTSATNVTATSTLLWIDQEALFVNQVSGTTLSVTRGYSGTIAKKHANASLIFLGPPYAFFVQSPSGACTRANIQYLPAIAFGVGGQLPTISDCIGGVWVTGQINPTSTTPFRVQVPVTNSVAYTTLNGTGTALIATELYCSEVNLPVNKLLTGIALLHGTAGTTDKAYVILYDNTGNVIANSAVAGVTGTGASVYQQYNFTSQYYAVGPAQYFACFQSNGTTDTMRMAVTGTADNLLTKGQTGVTFGTVPTLTVPTTFTTAVGPYVYLY